MEEKGEVTRLGLKAGFVREKKQCDDMNTPQRTFPMECLSTEAYHGASHRGTPMKPHRGTIPLHVASHYGGPHHGTCPPPNYPLSVEPSTVKARAMETLHETLYHGTLTMQLSVFSSSKSERRLKAKGKLSVSFPMETADSAQYLYLRHLF